MPTSIIQLWVPRVELHLFYNTIVFIPMIIGMYYHLFPPAEESPEVSVHLRVAPGGRGIDVLSWPGVGRFLRWRHARTAMQLVLLLARAGRRR